jgi:pyruvate dehydrogenase E2 component (dihydrolipoamide acetyltransferase)
MIKDITIPDIGETVETGVVAGILVSVGDTVEADQAIIEVETDKAVVEIPTTYSGKITEIIVKPDDEVEIGDVIARIDTEDAGPETPPAKPEEAQEKPKKAAEAEKTADEAPASPEKEQTEPPQMEAAKAVEHQAPAAPSIRRLARELGADINHISGSGPGGRITKDDVKAYVKRHMAAIEAGAGIGGAQPPLPDFGKWGEISRNPMTKVRELTAASMTQSWTTIPLVTQFDEADITEAEKFREQYHEEVEKAGAKLTITAILMKIVAAALQRFPRFNASIDVANKEIIYKKYYHIAMAVDTERGLVVPVIRDVNKKSIVELAVALTDLGERTRNKKVKPDELEGGTFTISNQGGIGGTNFTPLVYWPQSAILGISRASTKPRYINDKFEPRIILPLTLSYDHRIIDGADAARFLRWIVEALEHPLLLNLES